MSLQEKPQETGCRELRQNANLLLCLCMFLVAIWDDGLLSPGRPIILFASQVDMLSIQKGSIIYFLQRLGHDGRGQWHVFLSVKWKAPLFFPYVQHIGIKYAFPVTFHTSPREDAFTNFLLLLRLWVKSESYYTGFVISFNLIFQELHDNWNKSTYYRVFGETGN